MEEGQGAEQEGGQAGAVVTQLSLAEVKRPQEVIMMNIKDSLKFGVLIGLLEVKQVRDKELVDAVLHLVGSFATVMFVWFQQEKRRV